MAKLTRVTGKVFGSAALAQSGGIGQFGSAATGTPNPTTDVATIQALQAYLDGWGSAVITSRNFPPIEEVTGVLKTISYQTCYTLQEGIPAYDSGTEYSNTSIIKGVNNGVITLYASLVDNNTGNSTSDTTKWKATELKFNGSWVYADQTNAISTATAIGTYALTSAITLALPNDANTYECIFRYVIARKQDGGSTNTHYDIYVNSNHVLAENLDSLTASGSVDNVNHCGQFTAIIDSTRNMSIILANIALSNSELYLVAYRRVD